MQKRVISCKHCGERIRPDEEKCPYCNKKLEVDYASIYPAHPNKKYHLYMNSGKLTAIMRIISFAFPILMFTASEIFVIKSFYVPGKPYLIFLIPLSLILLAAVGMAFLLMLYPFLSYMRWDGKETVTVKQIRRIRQFDLNTIAFVTPHVIIQGRMSISCLLAVSKEGYPMFAVGHRQETEDFFKHFSIQLKSYEAENFSYFEQSPFE